VGDRTPQRGITRGPIGVAAIAAIAMGSLGPQARAWAATPHGRRFAAIAYPVAIGAATGEIVQPRRMIIGGIFPPSFTISCTRCSRHRSGRPCTEAWPSRRSRRAMAARTVLSSPNSALPRPVVQKATLSATAGRSRAGSPKAASGCTWSREARMRAKATTAAAASKKALTVNAVV